MASLADEPAVQVPAVTTPAPQPPLEAPSSSMPATALPAATGRHLQPATAIIKDAAAASVTKTEKPGPTGISPCHAHDLPTACPFHLLFLFSMSPIWCPLVGCALQCMCNCYAVWTMLLRVLDALSTPIYYFFQTAFPR